MTDIIYLVMRAEGSYDDYRNEPVKGYVDREKAEQAISILKEEDRRYNELVKPANANFREWHARNGFPATEPMLPIPRLPKGTTDVPAEFKLEKKRVVRENDARNIRNHDRQSEWNVKAEAMSRLILRELGATADELEMFSHPVWSNSIREYSYDIEELEVVW